MIAGVLSARRQQGGAVPLRHEVTASGLLGRICIGFAAGALVGLLGYLRGRPTHFVGPSHGDPTRMPRP